MKPAPAAKTTSSPQSCTVLAWSQPVKSFKIELLAISGVLGHPEIEVLPFSSVNVAVFVSPWYVEKAKFSNVEEQASTKSVQLAAIVTSILMLYSGLPTSTKLSGIWKVKVCVTKSKVCVTPGALETSTELNTTLLGRISLME